jgi:predicted peroxiredoxin
MAKILVHLTHGPEHPTRAALAFLVAKAAEFATPEALVRLAVEHDRMFTY